MNKEEQIKELSKPNRSFLADFYILCGLDEEEKEFINKGKRLGLIK